MKHKFSVVIPVYNAEVFVARTIDNIISQPVDKEILLVNDGSTDNSLAVLRDYELKYNCVHVINQVNKGVSAARNAGIEAATGDFLIFVDSDDMLEDNWLLYAEAFFKDDIDVVICSYRHVTSNYETISEIHYLPTGTYTIQDWSCNMEKLIHTYIVCAMSSKIYRVKMLRDYNIRFNEKLTIYEDLIFGFTYLMHVNKLFYVDEPNFLYVHLNNGSLFGKVHPEKNFAINEVVETVKAFTNKVFGVIDYDFLLKYEKELRCPPSKSPLWLRIRDELVFPMVKKIKDVCQLMVDITFHN